MHQWQAMSMPSTEYQCPIYRRRKGTKEVTPAGCQRTLPDLETPSGRRQSASVPAQKDPLQHLHSPDIILSELA